MTSATTAASYEEEQETIRTSDFEGPNTFIANRGNRAGVIQPNSGLNEQDWDERAVPRLLGVDPRKAWKPIYDTAAPGANSIAARISATGTQFEWEGVVLGIENDKVETKLVPLTGPNAEPEFTTLDLEDIPNYDHDLVCEGALFRLSLGRQVKNGTVSKRYDIVFRRLPAWNRKDLESAESKYSSFVEKFSKQNDRSTAK